MSPASAAGTAKLTATQLATQAAEAIRAMNHLTLGSTEALSSPAELDDVITALAQVTARLPQLLTQLASWLGTQHQPGWLRLDAFSPHPDPRTAIGEAIKDLTAASSCARQAGRALHCAHHTLAHLALATADGDEDDQRGSR
jgi:hypothetical protein